jgi:mono/diheme cytochrome c family protein
MRRILFAFLLCCVACAGRRTPVTTSMTVMPLLAPHAHAIDLASGDLMRGRGAFIALRCHACHRVAEDPTLPKVEGAWDGPVLANLGALSPEAVAWKIVSQTALDAEAIYDSPMEEAASAMSEQQLVDIVAYLRNPADAATPRR